MNIEICAGGLTYNQLMQAINPSREIGNVALQEQVQLLV
jgi:hypothetical protein